MIGRRSTFIAALAAVLLTFTLTLPTAQAQNLDSLRAQGKVGERYDGFAEARHPSANDVVKQVNAKRQKIYKDRAAEQGVTVEAVGRIYHRQIISQTPSGTYILSETGVWTQTR